MLGPRFLTTSRSAQNLVKLETNCPDFVTEVKNRPKNPFLYKFREIKPLKEDLIQDVASTIAPKQTKIIDINKSTFFFKSHFVSLRRLSLRMQKVMSLFLSRKFKHFFILIHINYRFLNVFVKQTALKKLSLLRSSTFFEKTPIQPSGRTHWLPLRKISKYVFSVLDKH